MKPEISMLITGAILFAALANPASLSAQQPRYKVIDLGPFNGGLQSYVNIPPNYAQVLNNNGVVAGWADTFKVDRYPSFCFNEDCRVSHAFQWQNGVKTDLGVLSGRVSSAGTWIDGNGLIAGVSENGQIDPLVTGFPELRAVLWTNGTIADLGTLPEGGYESAANAVNSSLGQVQVVGLALNTTPDPNSMLGLGYQTRAFLWQNGAMQDLGTLGGTDAMALLINEQGQIVGDSYTSSSVKSPYCGQALEIPAALSTGAFLWQDSVMTNLGGFGGTCTFASALNNQGQVTGGSTFKGDKKQHPFLWDHGSFNDLGTFGGGRGNGIAINEKGVVAGWATYPGDRIVHAALWTNGGITDLGTVDGDPCSVANSVNLGGQVVGVSVPCDFSQSRAFLWDADSIVDLNSLIPSDSTLYLTFPANINDSGEIAGVGLDSNGHEHAFLLIPCSETACQDAPAGVAFRPVPATTRPADNQNNLIHRMLRRQLGPLNIIADPSRSSAPSGSGTTSTVLPASKAPDILQDPAPFGIRTPALACLGKGQQCKPGFRCCPGWCAYLRQPVLFVSPSRSPRVSPRPVQPLSLDYRQVVNHLR